MRSSLLFAFLTFSFFLPNAAAQDCANACERAYQHYQNTGQVIDSEFPCLLQDQHDAAQKGDPIRRGKCLLMLTVHNQKKDSFDQARARLNTVGRILSPENAAHQPYLADMHNLLGYDYDRRGYQSLSVQSYKQAINLYDTLSRSDPQRGFADMVVNEVNLVKLLAQQGKCNEAIKMAKGTLVHFADLPNTLRLGELRAVAANNLAFAKTQQALQYRSDMRPAKMRQSAGEALAIFKDNLPAASRMARTGDDEAKGNYGIALLNTATQARMLGQNDTARQYVQMFSDSVGRIMPLSILTAYNRAISAVLHAQAGDSTAAFADMTLALQRAGIAQTSNFLETPAIKDSSKYIATADFVLTMLQLKGDILQLLYQQNHQIRYLEKSLDAYERSVQLCNALQYGLFADETVIAFRARFQGAYSGAARIAALLYDKAPPSSQALRSRYWQKAFEYAEQTRGFVLRQNIQANIQSPCPPGDASPRCREMALRDAVFSCRRLKNQKLLLAKLTEYEQFVAGLRASSDKKEMDYYNQRFHHQVPNLKAVQDTLLQDGRSVFIEYVWSAPQPFALWLTQQSKGLLLLDIPSGDDFWAQVERFQEGWLRDIGAQKLDPKLGYGLYQTLLKKVLDDIPATEQSSLNRLVISADNVLNTLPFDALLTDPTPGSSGASTELNYVVKKYTVGYQHSAALWQAQTRQAVRLERDALKIGSFINKTDQTGCSNNRPLRKMAEFSNKKLGAMMPGVVVVPDSTAVSALVFKQRAAEFDLLHFCMHGCLNADPEQSYLSFAGPKGDTLAGRLSVGDIYALYSMRLKARLVVFASCETARQQGEQEGGEKGEGVIGLYRAFNYAGCPNTIATLNQVIDGPTAKLLELFYNHLLKDGLPADEALAQAKRDYLNAAPDKNYPKHPIYWANFICVGPPAQFKP